MNHNKIIINTLAVIGLIFVGVLAHEFVHYLDYKNIITSGEIIIFSQPVGNYSLKQTSLNTNGFLGAFVFYPYPDKMEEYKKIKSYTELKATAIELIILFFGIWTIVKFNREYKLDKKQGNMWETKRSLL